MKNSQTSSPKHRVAAIMLSWPGHKYLISAKNTRIKANQQALDLVCEFPIITKKDHTEAWREAEKTISAAKKPFTLQYALFFEHSPMFSGEKNIPTSFKHGDFARSILNICKYGADWMRSLSSKARREEVTTAYKQFRENHEIIVTHENAL